MKEKLYGWYPPAKGIYANPRNLRAYEKECLYRHRNSRFVDKRRGLVSTPCSPAPSSSHSRSSRASSGARSISRCSKSTDISIELSEDLQRSLTITPAPSAPVQYRSPTPQGIHQGHTSLKHGWIINETASGEPATTSMEKDRQRLIMRSEAAIKKPRVQSATVRRNKVDAPVRPVTAGPVRPSRDENYNTFRPPAPVPPACDSDSWPDSGRQSVRTFRTKSSFKAAPRPATPATPAVRVATPVMEASSSPPRSPTPEYEDLLDKYGWRVEVHGDPFKIKKLPERLPYTIECPEPEIPPNPPKGHIENYGTFFLNTIPRKHATCVIHPEWVSEVLLARRMELQKKTGMQYRHTNYAFLY